MLHKVNKGSKQGMFVYKQKIEIGCRYTGKNSVKQSLADGYYSEQLPLIQGDMLKVQTMLLHKPTQVEKELTVLSKLFKMRAESKKTMRQVDKLKKILTSV